MLTEFQTQKMIHFYSMLDYTKNGKLTVEDFLAIAENLCVLWKYREGTEEYNEIIAKCKKNWRDLTRIMPNLMVEEITRKDWLQFVDQFLVNGEDSQYEMYVENFVNEIFDYFDTNKDGLISIEEFVDIFMAYHIEIRYSAKSFTKLDLNGDETLSREELLIAVRQYFRSDNKEDKGNWLFGFWNVSYFNE
ncbi:MAG: Ca2+-binding EF-hand superfamily protein [Cyclobacteriaceae bacterium]|jgi:Ca2+-binding EF-hand superfamily protein